jgi:serine/threonine protein kinase
VFRDLAARNLLVCSGTNQQFIIKISDFGLSRIVDSGVYTISNSLIPYRWSSIEVLKYGTFSTQSDIWSFGIVMWEIFNFGMIPYSNMSNQEVVQQVINGYRLNSPSNCSNEIQELIQQCWNSNPNSRPTFTVSFINFSIFTYHSFIDFIFN